jgi:hypothetical protein
LVEVVSEVHSLKGKKMSKKSIMQQRKLEEINHHRILQNILKQYQKSRLESESTPAILPAPYTIPPPLSMPNYNNSRIDKM